jgi:hypothetical protein
LARRAVVVAALLLVCVPGVARANGDPASDYLLLQSIFLPFDAKVDTDVTAQLSDVIRAADKADFPIKVAIIRTRYDLGTAFSLYNKPQRYAQFLGLELSFQYGDRLLVVMPNGYGYAVSGKPDPRVATVLAGRTAPGADATKQVEAATAAVRALAASAGHVLPAGGSGGGSSTTRDRITIAAGALALVAVLVAIVFYRRTRPPATE